MYVCAPEAGGCGEDICSDCSENAGPSGSAVLCLPCAENQPEPAAPEVVWEAPAVRVVHLPNGTYRAEVLGSPNWTPCTSAPAQILARALAEAKRERKEYERVAVRALTKAAREAARLGVADAREKCARIAENLGLRNLASILRMVE